MLQASSPDEIALVKFGETVGYKLESRDLKNIKIMNPSGVLEEYTIMDNFAFSSERKRMGIILRDDATKTYIFYLKGADQIMIPKVDRLGQSFISEECEGLAKEGLRTLVMTQRILREDEYLKWKKDYLEAAKDLKHREAKEAQVLENLEGKMELLGITGVEDLLQEDIKTVIENLRSAGIKVWMLTGRLRLTQATSWRPPSASESARD